MGRNADLVVDALRSGPGAEAGRGSQRASRAFAGNADASAAASASAASAAASATAAAAAAAEPCRPASVNQRATDEIIATGTRVGASRANDSVNAISVVGGEELSFTRTRVDAAQPERGTIALEPWAPNRPYLAALEAASPAELDRVFAEQQREHGGLPAFWLDVADWAFRKGRRDEAVPLVLSALDLPTRNNQTLSIVADRLMRYGEIDRAIWLLERLLAAEDDRPQPRRTLALALAKRAENAPPDQARADLARAISLLTEVVMTPWDNAYDGIEMISLMEANRLIPRYRALGGEELTLDPRLIALLDVDLRVDDRMEQRGDRRRPVGRRADRRAGHLPQSAHRDRRPPVERHDPGVRPRGISAPPGAERRL